jgi:hypothetical protein
VGERLARGQLIGSIAKSGGLAVAIKLDEADANRVRDGQAVTVTGPGFGAVMLTGKIANVAGEAIPAEGGQGGSTFAATAQLDPLSPAQVQNIRIGMTANVTIATYQTPAAIVVPPQAIQGADPAATVMVRDPKTRQKHLVPVVIGAIAPDGAEIRSGLKAGDEVIWSGASPLGRSRDAESR